MLISIGNSSIKFIPQDFSWLDIAITARDAPLIAVIVLNYNGWRDTIRCLTTLYRVSYPNYHIIVVDNGSEDNSVIKIVDWALKNRIRIFVVPEEYAQKGVFRDFHTYVRLRPNERVVLILNRFNYGYAGGMNRGIIFAKKCFKADYIVLLNNDTVVDKDFLMEMYMVIKQSRISEKIGVLGPRVLNYYTNNIVPIEQYILPIPFASVLMKLFSNIAVIDKHYRVEKPLVVNRLDGSCYMIKAKVIDQVGLLNEDFFTYWEDTDFFVRVRKSGYLIVLAPRAIIKHKIGATNIETRKVNPRAAYYFGRNAIRFINLHYYRCLSKIGIMVAFILTSLYLSSMYLLYYRSIKAFKFFILGVVRGLLKEKGKSNLFPI